MIFVLTLPKGQSMDPRAIAASGRKYPPVNKSWTPNHLPVRKTPRR